MGGDKIEIMKEPFGWWPTSDQGVREEVESAENSHNDVRVDENQDSNNLNWQAQEELW